MCCLFGFIDYSHKLSERKKLSLLRSLSVSAMERGKDATGIAFNSKGTLRIYKKALPANKVHLFLPDNSNVVMGHTRLATKGTSTKNYNNHPWIGKTLSGDRFAFAHNGVIINDNELRKKLNLHNTKIETDSFVVVQMLSKLHTLTGPELSGAFKDIVGTYTFTLLDAQDNLYIAKGSNPITIVNLKSYGIIIYASTTSILVSALTRENLIDGEKIKIPVDKGELLKFSKNGNVYKTTFEMSDDFDSFYLWDSYIDYDIYKVAAEYGYSSYIVDDLIDIGFSDIEIEDLLHCPEEMADVLDELYDMGYCVTDNF